MLPAILAYPLVMVAVAALPAVSYPLLAGVGVADIPLGEGVFMVDRALVALATAAVAVWAALNAGSARYEWPVGLATAGTVALLLAPRPIYQTAYGLLQVALLAALIGWRRREPLTQAKPFLLLVIVAHAIGALVLFPVCQTGAGAAVWSGVGSACGAWWGSAWNPQLILVLGSAAVWLALLSGFAGRGLAGSRR